MRYRYLLITIATIFALLIIGAYGSWIWYGENVCKITPAFQTPTQDELDCTATYLQGIFNPFYSGFLLKSIVLSALILLAFSRRVFRIWVIGMPIYLIITVAYIFSVPPYTNALFDKVAYSDVFGYLFLGLTIVLALSIAGYERLQQSRKRVTR